MKQNLFQPRRRIEKRYEDAIKGIMGLMKRKLNGVSSPFILLKTLRGIARSPTYDRLARQAAEAMATHLFTDGARSWREAALKGSKGRLIYKALRKELKGNATYWEIVERNADLIKTMPLNFAKKATKMMAENAMTGERSESKIEDIMRLWPHYTKAHALLHNLSESFKMFTLDSKHWITKNGTHMQIEGPVGKVVKGTACIKRPQHKKGQTPLARAKRI